ncbi:hypothetical protein [Methylorubrum rhodesianum]|uniref:hypothetical protein n=1 Tax=Methylorubrum TaxID=2282523 RepID=UPI00059D6941
MITSALRPASESGIRSGATGIQNFSHADQSVATLRTRRIPASSIPTRARFRVLLGLAAGPLVDARAAESLDDAGDFVRRRLAGVMRVVEDVGAGLDGVG